MARLAPGNAAEALKGQIPLKRYATIEEIAHAVLFVVSPAGSFMTGSMLLMDGGLALLGGRFLGS
jgi:NAD(P)-dependent dehydrogenase (short-subunit alcohol dehydrogenase family)